MLDALGFLLEKRQRRFRENVASTIAIVWLIDCGLLGVCDKFNEIAKIQSAYNVEKYIKYTCYTVCIREFRYLNNNTLKEKLFVKNYMEVKNTLSSISATQLLRTEFDTFSLLHW